MSLFQAIRSHDLKFFNKCLKDSNIDKKNSDGVTCIHIAAGLDNIQFLEGLLNHGADINCKTSEGLTPLHIAAMWGRAEQTQLLLEYGADVTEKDHRGCDAYKYALDSQGENRDECLVLIATHLNELVTMDESMFKKCDIQKSSARSESQLDRLSLEDSCLLQNDKSEYEVASSDSLPSDYDNSGFAHQSCDSIMFQTAYGSPDMSQTPTGDINIEKLEGSPFITPRSKKRQQRSLTDVFSFNGFPEKKTSNDSTEKQIVTNVSSHKLEEINHKLSTIFEVEEKSRLQTLTHYMTELSLDMLSNSGESDQPNGSDNTMKENDMFLGNVSNNSENLNNSVRTPGGVVDSDVIHDDRDKIQNTSYGQNDTGSQFVINGSLPEFSEAVLKDSHSPTGENSTNFMISEKQNKVNDPDISEEETSKTVSTTPKDSTQTVMGSTFIISSADNKIDLKNHQNIFIPFEDNFRKSSSKISPSKIEVVQQDVKTPEQTVIYDWKDCSMTSSSSDEPRICIPPVYHKLTTEEIKKRIVVFGEAPGPITAYTKEVYLRKLIKLEQGDTGKSVEKKNSPFVQYPAEVRMVLLGRTPVPELSQLEEEMVKEFGDKKKQWREGNEKSSFNYLLLDPRVSCNLPARYKNLSNTEAFRIFILSVFYVGKGKRARPHAHLREAVKSQTTGKVNKKISQIWDIWDAGLGIVSLHVFQSAIPAEAFTREACMIDALGLPQLTNKVRGSYHGLCSSLPLRKRKNLGIFFFYKAYQIFLQEGERQIKRDDI